MKERWARPDRSPEAAIEIPLLDASSEPVDAGHPAAPSPSPTNWRRVIGVAGAAGIALGIVVAVVLLTAGDGDDDDDVAPTDTTLAPDELATAITTPPTLPRPGAEQLAEMDGLSSQDRLLFDLVPSITAPQYPNLDLPDGLLERYDLPDALDRLADDVPRRATTRYEVGEEAYRIDVSITRDVVRDRYEIVVDGAGDDARLVVDLADDLTYISTESDAGAWAAVPNDELDGDANVATMVGRLLRGPVRADTVRSAVLVTPGPAVTIRDSAPIARRFAVTLRAGQVPEWARYQLGAVADAPPPDPDDPIGFFAYVSDGGAVVEVNGTFPFGNTEQLVVHRIETLPDDFEIELPEVTPTSTVPTPADPPETSDSPPATTTP